jgi:iron complex outermembrane receptor protein
MHTHVKISVQATRLALAMLAGSSFSVAHAQTAPENTNAPATQRVEITGSSIKRTATESAGSILTLTREDIAQTGANTALGVLTNTVAVSASINSANSSSGSFATGASGAGMRGLGKAGTLVLVNGRRIAPYGLSDGAQENFTNLDAIAANAIERIEILKDGASAIYGSDAVAGVINIILRKEFKGGLVTGGYRTQPGFNKGNSKDFSASYGFGDLDTNGYNTYLTFEEYKRDGYTTDDLRNEYPAWHRLTPGRSTWDAKSAYSPTGNYFLSSTNIVAAPGCPASNIDPADKQCKFDTLPFTGQTTNSTRHAVVSNTHFKIGKDINANFDLTYADASNSYIVAPFTTQPTTSSNIWYNAVDNKLIGPFFFPKLPVGHPNNPNNFPVEYRARLMDTGNGFNFNTTESKQYRAMLALDGTIGNYDWKSAIGHMDSTADKSTRAYSAKGYTDAIVNNTYKFGAQNSPAVLESMFPVRTTKGHSKITFADATVTGELMQLPAGPLSFAVGGDVRHESYEMKSSDNVLKGDLVGIFGLQVKDARSQFALFTEMTIPVVKTFEISAALRADKTQGFDTHVSPKLSFRFTPTDSWLFRGTAATGFRAPNIVETGNGLGRSSVATSVNDLRRCPIANDLNNLVQGNKSATAADKALANTYRSNDCAAGLPSFVASNPDLKPETSRSYTLGLVFAPNKTWSFAIDYFNIERKDEIGTRTVADILKAESSLPAGQLLRVDNSKQDNEFLALVKKYAPNNTLDFQNIGKLGMVYNPYVNSGKTKVSGLDFDLNAKFNVASVGEVKVKMEGFYGLNYQTYNVGDKKYDPDQFDTYDQGGRVGINMTTSLKRGNWTNAVIVNFTSGYSTNSLGSPTYCTTQKVAPEFMATCGNVGDSTFLNYNLTYAGFKNTKINLYVGNLTNKDNPVDWRGGWTPRFRTVYLSGEYRF